MSAATGRELHELLRELVERQGAGVIETPEAFRAALDDFLTEDEATLGELNLLADAVRLGAVDRLLSMLDNGAEPHAAVAEAGDALARDRGTEDLRRTRWAVAAVGYALGRVDAASSRRTPGSGGAGDTQVPPEDRASGRLRRPPLRTPRRRRPVPRPRDGAQPGPRTRHTLRTLRRCGHLGPPATAAQPAAVPVPEPRRRRGLADRAGGAGAAARRRWSGGLGAHPGRRQSVRQCHGRPHQRAQRVDRSDRSTSTSNTVLVPIKRDGSSKIYAVDPDDPDSIEPITSGDNDNFPAISPDRETIVYLDPGHRGRRVAHRPRRRPPARAGSSSTAEDACDYARRPAFSPDGQRFALTCIDAGGESTGMYIVDPEGARGRRRSRSTGWSGGHRPTWVSQTQLVASVADDRGRRPSLWLYDIQTAEADAADVRPRGLGHPPGLDRRPEEVLLFVRSTSEEPAGELLDHAPRRRARAPRRRPTGARTRCGHPTASEIAFRTGGRHRWPRCRSTTPATSRSSPAPRTSAAHPCGLTG